jgi:heme/copper-type cytochrome/quinol oxidase subunit 4
MARKKIKKEELQEDKLIEFMVLATKFIEDNMKKIIAGIVAVIIIGGSGWLYTNYHTKMIVIIYKNN